MKAFDIVGYTFNADEYCPDCIVGAYNGNSNDYDSETMLDILAGGKGIDRMDESSFDSGYFPKVIFASQVESAESDICGSCHQPLVED